MIDAVLLFGALNCVFEFVLLCMLPPRARLRLLGSDGAKACCHVAMLTLNLIVHWGTLVGSMSAVLAFCASLITVKIATILFGQIRGSRYTYGLIRYSVEEVR